MGDGRKKCPQEIRANRSDTGRLGSEKTPIHQSSGFHPNDLDGLETTVESSDDNDTSISMGACVAMEKDAERQHRERQIPMNGKGKGHYEKFSVKLDCLCLHIHLEISAIV